VGDGSIFSVHQGPPFKASAGWAQDFNKEHKIRQRHMVKYIISKNNATFEEIGKGAELFQKQIFKMIQNHSLDCVININQMGFEYHVSIR
jgi:hypothetical protein